MFSNINSKISADMKEIEIIKLIKSEEYKDEYFKEIIDLSNNIKDGKIDTNDLTQLISNNINNVNFRNIIIKETNEFLESFFETQFTRDIQLTDFKKYFETVFLKLILQVSTLDTVSELIKLEKNDIITIVKILNFSKYLILVKRSSEELFIMAIYDKFRLDKDKTEYIWNLFDTHKKELIVSVLMENTDIIRKMNKSISMIVDIFQDLIDEE